MEITVSTEPFKKWDVKPRLKIPTDALSFFHHQQMERVMSKHYKITLLEEKPNIVGLYQFRLVDGLHRTYNVEILKGVVQCSCREFYEQQASYCEHAAIISLVWNYPKFYPHTWQFIAEIKRRKTKNILGASFTYNFYNGKTNSLHSMTEGRKAYKNQPIQVIDSITLANHQTSGAVRNQINLAVKPVSDGTLLNGLKLYDYQEIIFQKMLVAQKAICSMKMGAGKTLTTLACYGWILKNLNDKARLLVICPKSLKIQWRDELQRALGVKSFLVNDKKGLAIVGQNQVEIVTYQTFAKHWQVFTKAPYQAVVMDEIQFIRNNESKAWKAANEIQTDFFYGLSGTVIENRLDDLYSIMEIVAPGALGPKWKFSDQFQELLSVTKKVIVFGGVKNLPSLQEKLKDRVFSYGDLQLPNIQHTYVPVTLTSHQQQLHDNNFAEAQKLLAKSMTQGLSYAEKMVLQSYLLKARQACNSVTLITKKPSQLSSKLQEICSIAQNNRNSGRKVIFFSQWTEMLDLISDELRNLGIDHVFYTGRETEIQRSRSLDKFMKDSSVSCFLASDSGGVGIDGLQLVCNVVVHVELPWNPARLDQRTGRVYRIGQTKPVDVFYLYAKESIEEKMLETLQKKRDIRTLTLDMPKE
jgi:SNF2 family DNA or RNA helicase